MEEAGGPVPPHRATIKDVAAAAGVSRSTASRALTGSGYVGHGVRERVQQAATGLGYVPDAAARHLRQRAPHSIGLLVPDLRDAFCADLAAGTSRGARRRGYTLVLAGGGQEADQVEAAEQLVALRVGGVVLTPASAGTAAYLARHHVPVVEVDRHLGEGRTDAVVVDGAAAAQRAAEHLAGLGHRRTALLADEPGRATSRDAGAARAAAHALLSGPDRPTAVLAATHVLAEGVWRAAAELGLRVPGDLSVVALDDAPWMSVVTPGVTAVVQDVVAMGEAAVARLVERLASPDAPPRTTVLGAVLCERGSTAPPAG